MKKQLLLLLAVISLYMPAKASHVYGGEMTYKHVSGNTYLIELTLYRQCTGIALPATTPIQASSGPLCGGFAQYFLQLTSVKGLPVNNCDSTISYVGCNSPGGYGIEVYTYSGLITLPFACDSWVLNYTNCCMSSTVDNIFYAGSELMVIEVHIDNLNYPGNSSPDFNFEPLTGFCNNTLNCYNHSASDQDGDSISYNLIAYPNVSYVGNYSGLNPIPTTSGTNLDAISGIMSFTPNMMGEYIVSVEANEYRNGVWIGSIKRNVIYSVFNGIFPTVNYTTGTVFKDFNNNQVQDSGEPGIPNIIIGGSPVATFGSSNSAGQFGLHVPAGTSTISIPNVPKYHTATPLSHTIVTTGVCTADSGRHFALYAPPGITDVSIEMNESSFARPGRVTRQLLTLKNLGTDTIASGTIIVSFDTSLTYINSVPPADTVIGNLVTWTYTSLLPGECRYFHIDLRVDSMQALQSVLHSTAQVTPTAGDSDLVNNVDSLQQIVRGSFDPNDKYVEPAGDLHDIEVNAGLWLEYTVRFQNTGTDTAFYIMIVDTLDANLDLLSFEMLSASHSFNLSATGPGLLKWEFVNILLPDSNVDELGSQGFVKYRIKPQSNLPIGTVLSNAADIYFDLNAPIKTNRTYNTIVATTGINSNINAGDLLNAYPNPSSGLLELRFNAIPEVNSTITVFDLMGRMVTQINISGAQSIQIDISDQADGMYILLYSSNTAWVTERIILSK